MYLKSLEGRGDFRVCNVQTSTNHAQKRVRLFRLHFLRNQPVQPPGIHIIILKSLRLQQSHQILDRGPEIPPDA